jgi:Xaa-Pro aminopeptidase
MRHAHITSNPKSQIPNPKGVLTLFFVLALAAWLSAERFGYQPEEFTARRAKLAAALRSQSPEGTLILFGSSAATPGVRFRQDHDFFYLTGNESLNAVLVMDVATGESRMFMPRLTRTQVQYDGGNWLDESGAAAKYGFTAIEPLTALKDFMSSRPAGTLWARLSEADVVDLGRGEVRSTITRRRANPLAQYPTEDAARVEALKAQYPALALRDATPHIDRLRMIKTSREIEILRYNGRVSAEAMVQAIRASGPGTYEYELEAAATGWMLKHGLQAAAYPAIVGSGPMGNQWHYQDNGRRMNAGELVVMDYGGSLDYLTMDITRTWPVSGRFTPGQQKAYEAVLDTQKTMIAAIKPGVTRLALRTLAERTLKAHGFDPRYAYMGHYVGLSVHDVGDWSAPFEEGMVLAIEPIVDIPEQQLHIRVEDTVLVTAKGTEVLSTAVPKEIDPLLALIKR